MPSSEFSVIQDYFSKQIHNKSINRLGVGDDCALMSIPAGYELAVTTDTMVEGVHFFAETDPFKLAHKLLAVNLSDLAAMGAKPISVTLALTLPTINDDWLKAFSSGFFQIADQFRLDLIGGDTTSGPLTLTIQALGLVPEGKALTRSTAEVGDLIFVTGQLGNAGLGLKILNGYQCKSPVQPLNSFHQPIPRVSEGLAISHYASSCIDLSDGIASDLKHILKKSGIGAIIDWDKIPMSEQVKNYIEKTGDWSLPLSAGEDYELCFTVSENKVNLIDIDCIQIGIIEQTMGLRINRFGKIEEITMKGFEHFV